jgi:hypothetical protein
MKLLTATLVKNPRQVTTKFGPKIVADCKLETGEDVTLWQPENSQIINYVNGSKISLMLDSKGKYRFVETENNYAPENAIAPKIEPNNHKFDKVQKQEIASYVSQQKELLQFCWKEASMIDGPSTEESMEVTSQ